MGGILKKYHYIKSYRPYSKNNPISRRLRSINYIIKLLFTRNHIDSSLTEIEPFNPDES
ncbi:hypothetical protein GCM10028774_04210 [Spirosoma jeollabukense]